MATERQRESTRFEDALKAFCTKNQMRPAVFQIISDRKGGRTAWSATVEVQGQTAAARYWYDGQFVNNAKEDAAEVMLTRLNPTGQASAVQQQQAQQPTATESLQSQTEAQRAD